MGTHARVPTEVASKLRKDGANLTRGMTDMLDALNRKRGKGPQVVRVKHVVVHEGGQAIVGNVQPAASEVGGGEGMTSKLQKKPKRELPNWRITLPLAQASPTWRTHQDGHALQGTSDGLREVQEHGGASTGPRTSEGLERIRKARTTHGRRTAEMDRMRAMVRVLMAGAKRLVERR